MPFPGNQLLLGFPGIKVLATPEAREAVANAVQGEVHWFNHGPDFIERTMRHRYSGDPLVMRLLDEYLALVDRTNGVLPCNEDDMLDWPKNDL